MDQGQEQRVLLITYYWPPAGGGGVHRWLKFIKYLPDFNITPIVYTPEDPDYPVVDTSLLEEVRPDQEIWRHPIWEPYGYYRKFMGLNRDKKIYSGFITENDRETLRQKISVFIRGNFFIPDARKFWIKPSIAYLTQKLQEEPVDLIISTGPPHSMHLIAAGLRQALHIPWIADFRDPWTGIDFYDQLRLTLWGDRKHHTLERHVLQTADAVVTVSPQWKLDLEKLSGRSVEVITNGFDDADFSTTETLTENFTLTHLGSVNADRNAPVLWEALDELLRSHTTLAEHFRLHLIGPIDQTVLGTIQGMPALWEKTELTPWVEHTEAIKAMQSAQVLLLLLNDTPNKFGIIPGKLFEYLGTHRPILCIGPVGGDADHVLTSSGADGVIDFQDKASMQSGIMRYFDAYLDGGIPSLPEEHIQKYARRNLVRSYADLMQKTIHHTP